MLRMVNSVIRLSYPYFLILYTFYTFSTLRIWKLNTQYNSK